MVDDNVWAFGDDIELIISDDRGNFDDDILFRDQSRLFQVHPHKHIGDDTPWLWRSINAPFSNFGANAYRLGMDEPQLTVSVVRIDKQLDLPAYAHEGDAGLDLMAREEVSIAPAGGRILMPTGISVAIPSGFAGFVLPRSGLALKNGVTVLNSPGLIDSAYRGEIKVILVNTDPRNPYKIMRGDRIAQLVIQPVASVLWNEVNTLDGANRGGGFGHSGR